MSLGNMLRKNFWGQYLISEYHALMSHIMPVVLTDEKAIKKYYKKKSNGIVLDLNNPQTFSEKQQWYKLHARLILMQKCADKLAVREYVSEKGYGGNLNALYGVYKSSREIDYSAFPDKFVLKATHGSAMNYIVTDKSKHNKLRTAMMMNSWLRQNIAWSGREWVYMKLPRRIIAEKYLEDETGNLKDYKFFCFNGEPKFIQVTGNRFTSEKYQNFYDLEWRLLPFGKDLLPNLNVHLDKPSNLDYMIKMASDLCKPFQFVRVDLFHVNGKVYFGEMTFFPAGGAPDFRPPEYDKVVGDMWQLIDIKNEV